MHKEVLIHESHLKIASIARRIAINATDLYKSSMSKRILILASLVAIFGASLSVHADTPIREHAHYRLKFMKSVVNRSWGENGEVYNYFRIERRSPNPLSSAACVVSPVAPVSNPVHWTKPYITVDRNHDRPNIVNGGSVFILFEPLEGIGALSISCTRLTNREFTIETINAILQNDFILTEI